ncbi:chemotaxis protein CheB [Acidisoma sp. 7E03]
MPKRDIIVIGSSAGGVEATMQLCAGLPADLDAAVFLVQHVSPSARSVMAQLLNRSGPLPAVSPSDGQIIEPGHVYVAGPDHHLLLRPGRILMRRGPQENRVRPSVNALFRSAAVAYGARVIGLVLTGLLDDGTDGLIAIKAAGGYSLVQDPEDAEWPSMPRNAVRRDHVDKVAPLNELPAVLVELSQTEAPPTVPLPPDYAIEDKIAAEEFAVMSPAIVTPGQPSFMSCPDCGGVLNVIDAGGQSRFRCQVGHAFSSLGLAEAQTVELERALAVAIRTHRDRIKLFQQMSDSASARRLHHAVSRWQEARREAEGMIFALEQAAAQLRRMPAPEDTAE